MQDIIQAIKYKDIAALLFNFELFTEIIFPINIESSFDD